MTDRLDENQPRMPRSEELGQELSDAQQGFWADAQEPNTRRKATDATPLEEVGDVPAWVRKDVMDEAARRSDEDEAPENGIPSWLRLSRTVGVYDMPSDSMGNTDYAALYPKAQGGRVVVRGPVDAQPYDDEGEYADEMTENESNSFDDELDEQNEPFGVAEVPSPNIGESEGLSSDYENAEDAEVAHTSQRRRWPFGRSRQSHAFESVWQDVEFEPIVDTVETPLMPEETAGGSDAPGGGFDADTLIPVEPVIEYQATVEQESDEYLQSSVASLPDAAFQSLTEGEDRLAYVAEYVDAPEVGPAVPVDLPIIEPEPRQDADVADENVAVRVEESVVDQAGEPGTDGEPVSKEAEVSAETPSTDVPERKAARVRSALGRLARGIKGKRPHKPRKRTVIIACVVLAALLVVYIVGVVRVSGVFPPNTGIGECDVSGMTEQQAAEALAAQTENYTLTVTVGDFAVIVDGASVSVDRDEPRIAREAFERQSPFLWPISSLFHYDPGVDQGITYDNVKFDKRLNDAVDDFNKKTLPATDAKVEYDSTTQQYSLSGSVEGMAVDKETVLNDAHDAISIMRSSIKPDRKTALRQAEVSDLPQYTQAVDNANTVRNTSIPVLVQGQQVVVCDPLLIRSWVSVTDTPAVVVDTIAMQTWADTTLSPLVYKSGEWGEVFLDTNTFVGMFAERLQNGEPGPVEAVTYDELNREGTSRQQAYENSPWNKELGRYIDVDLTAQFSRLFDQQGNVLWESAFVSGDMYAGHQTITGTYQLYAHERGQVLVGLDYNNDGKPDYESYVNFWMPFYGGYGLHDATWRDSFGGDLYLYNGSHGCINLPYEKAEELFNMTSIGDNVYVHE